MLVRLKPPAPLSQIKHSTTEQLPSPIQVKAFTLSLNNNVKVLMIVRSLYYKFFYLRRFSESRSSGGSTPSVRPSVRSYVRSFVRSSVRNTFGVPTLCNL